MDYQAQAAPAQQYAGVGSRFLAFLIDLIITFVVILVLDLVFGLAIKNTGPAIGGGLGGLIALIYYFYMEATQGGTFGKKALGLRIVKEDGSPIGWSESIIRNLLRIIDGLFAYLIGAILIWTSPRKQRLGDRAAHTVVIKTR